MLEQFNKLEKGKRYTLVGMTEFGFPYKVQFTLESVEYGTYAQYREAVTLRFKQKNKRKISGTRFYGLKECLVYEGWVEPKTDMWANADDLGDGVKRSMASFDTRFMQIAKNSIKAPALIELNLEAA